MSTGGDTIAAIATAVGVGGVGIVRLSGPEAIAIAAETIGVSAAALDRRVRLGWARDHEGRRLDQVIAFAMRAPGSFTGEDVAELHGHGGAHNLERLLASVVARGARIAQPGEFTRRAVASGKLDLIRAEALLDVIHAGSERAWRIAQANLDGRLGEQVVGIERRALAVLAELEGWIDFPEQDLEVSSAAAIDEEVGSLARACRGLVDGFRHASAVSRGVSVALVGAVNVGKSSLLNALVGRERALVGAAPGTTRDWLEVETAWNGVSVTLIDTAGIRRTDDPVEQRGIELGEARVASADVVVVVNDGAPGAEWDHGARFHERGVVVRSKADLGVATASGGAVIATSAITGLGLDELRARVLRVAGVADQEGSEQAFVTTARQRELASAAADAFGAALAARSAGQPPEVVAVELREAASALAELRGVEVGERVLDEVFARFCIGK